MHNINLHQTVLFQWLFIESALLGFMLKFILKLFTKDTEYSGFFNSFQNINANDEKNSIMIRKAFWSFTLHGNTAKIVFNTLVGRILKYLYILTQTEKANYHMNKNIS